MNKRTSVPSPRMPALSSERRWGRRWLALTVVWAGCSGCFDRPVAVRGQARATPHRVAADARDQGAPKRVRRAAVAGSWYPGDRAQLIRELDTLLAEGKKEASGKVHGRVIALVSPHAGYRYSGKAAAAGFSLLRGQGVKRVIVLGVAHRVPFAGASIADVTHYETPLGEIPVDLDAVARLRQRAASVVKTVAAAHAQEHSLEMQLPLLQRVAPGFSLVPLLLGRMGQADYGKLADALAEIIDEHTVVVASSDFTHRGRNYGYEVAAGAGSIKERLARLDRGSVERILALDRRGLIAHQARTGTTICGLRPVATLLELLKRGAKQPAARVVSQYTSGDVTGDWTSTVSYVDLAFTGAWPAGSLARARSAGAASFPLSAEQKRTLLELARRSLEASVKKGRFDAAALAARVPASLLRKAGAFVTLKCKRGAGGRCVGRGHDLRGCIGTIAPSEAVYNTVAQRAASAALSDRRFPRVEATELGQIAVEVSVLTPPKAVSRAEEIIVGRHGIILRKGMRSATFLPQVAPEQGWDRETTLSRLSRKAGLGLDGWRQGATFQVYEAIVFAER